MTSMTFQPAVMKENGKFYPRIKFTVANISDSYYLNKECPTRGKALAKAKKYIKKVQSIK
jgi:hypothetical protein